MIATLPLAACATTLPPARLSALAPEYQTPSSASVSPRRDFLTLFDDPGLAKLVSDGIANSPTVEAAIARIAIARGQLGSTAAAQVPTLDASVSVQRQRSSVDQTGQGAPGVQGGRDRTLVQPGVTASLDLDLFGRLRADRRAADLRLDAASADARSARTTLQSDIARQWAAARTAMARIAVARRNIADSGALVDITRVRVRAGLVPALDEARGVALLAGARAALPPLERDRIAAIATLAQLTTLPAPEIATLLGDAATVPSAPSFAAGVPTDLLASRPDVLAAERRLAAADSDVASTARRRFPSLILTGTLGFLTSGFPGTFTGETLAATFGGALSGQLLDFGRIRSLVAERTGQRAEALANYRSVVLQAVAEVDIALADQRAQAARATEIEAQVVANADSASLNAIRYRRGLSDFLAVLDSQRELNAARDARLVTDGAALDAAIRLWRAAGGVD